MNVSLLYNKTAGEGISADDLRAQIERGGHQVVRTVQREADMSALLAPPVEVVVAAGGDGTIASAARVVAGSGIPLAILPLGTANNIARSLGINGALPELIESWRHATRVPFDLGACSAANESFVIVEGVGAGLIAEGISAATQAPETDHPDVSARIVDHLHHYHDELRQMRPSRFVLAVDGKDMSGDYLVVEVLNIPSIGPNVVFAPDVTPSDGFLSVVTADEQHRNVLLAYLDNRMAGRAAPLSLPNRLATTVEMSGGGALHLDDESRAAASLGPLSLQIRPAALHVLIANPATRP